MDENLLNDDCIDNNDNENKILNDPLANQNNIEKINIETNEAWEEINRFLMINNMELYDTMRFNIDNEETYEKEVVENQKKFKEFISNLHHKDCKPNDYDLIKKRTIE